jgi:hypothetical protein
MVDEFDGLPIRARIQAVRELQGRLPLPGTRNESSMALKTHCGGTSSVSDWELSRHSSSLDRWLKEVP